jgi:dolichyl-phosphate-mannose--protein O-mannosyl transferase
MYIFAKRVWRTSFWAFFTTIIFTFDFMHFAQTRIATIDTYVTFFIVAAYYFMYMYYETSFYKVSLRRTLSYLFFSGMFFGLATASKWPGLYAGIGLAVLFFYSIYRRYRESLYARDIGDMITVNKFYKYTWSTLLFCLFAFIIVPVGIYVLSYIPMLKAPGQNGIKTILSNQTYMLDYHKNIHQEHPFESKWWQWPLMIRPIFYYVSASSSVAKTGSEIKQGISSFGNPAVWWVGIVAFFMSFKYMSKKYDSILIFFVIGLLSQYLPWSLITRTAFIYHFFPSVPFLVFLITVFFRNNYKKFGCYVYLTVTVLLFILFYPILSAMPVSTDYVNSILKWLPTWNLI